ncbi:Serine-aspartate repeat-containing protein D [Nymphon striatum]|nr:Serine-aspartate repeat-containing protein D [Nymphon striatum]
MIVKRTTLLTIGANDSDPDGTIDPSTVDLDPVTAGIQSSFTNADGSYVVDGLGNVTFTPSASLNGNPTAIPYTVNDNDGVPSPSNPTTLATIGANDSDPDGTIDPATVDLDPTTAGIQSTLTNGDGSVAGIVYEDTNGNGTQDSTEFGIPGIYKKTHLPGGSTQTEGTDPTVVTVVANNVATDIDGYQPPNNSGEVIGVIYNDTNGNGTQDASEPGISGVQVVITDSEGNSQTVTTDTDGTYGATVPAGSTSIDIVNSTLPVGSTQTEGTDPTVVTVPANGFATDRDGFNTPIVQPLLGLVEGIVYLDTNNNGQQDNGEAGIANVRVNITDSNGTTVTVITNAAGQYSQSVVPGATTIDIVNSDLDASLTRSQGTDPTVVTVIAGSVANDIDGFSPPQPEPPVAVDDSKLNQPLGQAVTVKTVSNDSDPNNNLDPTTVKLLDPSGNPVTSLVVTGEGTWTVDPTSGDITFTPEAGFLGDPTPVKYTVKDTTNLESNIATVTIDYEEPAAIIGTVWLDRDKDNEIDPNEDRKAGWTLKIKDKDGNVIATTVTDAQGNYSVTGLMPDEYTVEFFNTKGTLIAIQSTEGPLLAGETMDLPLPIDPSGVVYDSTTRELIAGVTLQLVNSQGVPVDESCVSEGQQNQVTAEDGLYAFDVYPDAHSSCPNGETYTIKITSAPAGYYTNSTIIPPQTGVYDSDSNESNCTVDAIANSGSCEVQGQPDAPQGNQDTTYFMDFELSSGDNNVIFNHIPLDSEIARHTELDDETVLLKVDVRDDLPTGFKFVSSQAKLTRAGLDNSFGTSDDIVSTISVSGVDPVGNAAASQTNAVNTVQVFASGSEDDIASNIATATVAIVADSVLDQSTLIGKVFHDRDGDGYQDPANVTGLTVKSDYFGWNSLHLGGINGRVSVLR